MTSNINPHPVLRFRRLAANVYDGVIVVALWIVATFLILPFTHGKAIPAGTRWFQLYCLGIMLMYFVASWLRFSQTIGMRAWRIKVVTTDDHPLTLRHALLRFFAAIPAYLSVIGVWFAWHDVVSKTRMIADPLDAGLLDQ